MTCYWKQMQQCVRRHTLSSLHFSQQKYHSTLFHLPHIFMGASNSSNIGWLMNISRDFRHKLLTSFSVKWTVLAVLELRTMHRQTECKYRKLSIEEVWQCLRQLSSNTPLKAFAPAHGCWTLEETMQLLFNYFSLSVSLSFLHAPLIHYPCVPITTQGKKKQTSQLNSASTQCCNSPLTFEKPADNIIHVEVYRVGHVELLLSLPQSSNKIALVTSLSKVKWIAIFLGARSYLLYSRT